MNNPFGAPLQGVGVHYRLLMSGRTMGQVYCTKWQNSLTLCLFTVRWLLYLFYRYYFGHCYDELAACIPPPMARPHSTRQASFAQATTIVRKLSKARINRFSDGFFPATSPPPFGTLPSSVFLTSFNLPSFKRQVYHHLKDQMA